MANISTIQLMKKKPLQWCMVAFSLLWLVWFQPGHKRGAVSLDQSKPSTLVAQSCCHASPGYATVDDESDSPEPFPTTYCAICKIKASLVMAPPVLLLKTVKPLLIEQTPIARHTCTYVHPRQAKQSRAPPLVIK